MRLDFAFILLLSASFLAVDSASAQAPGSGTNAPAPPGGPQGVAQTLTLEQAEATALKNNPQITIGKLRALQAQQYVRETRSFLLPTASLNLTGVGADSGSRLAAGFLNNPTLFTRAAAGTAVNQLVTDFGRTTNLVSSSQYHAKAEDQNAEATRADIVLAVDQGFYTALETKALVTVAQQTVETRQILTDKIKALTDAKLKSDLDLSFAQVQLAQGKLLLLEAQNNYESSLATLSAILGYPEEQNFQLLEETVSITPPAPDVNQLILQGLHQRPEIAALEDEVASAEKFGRAEHDLQRPTVSALGAVGLAPVRDNQVSSWYGAVGVNIQIPVFTGFLFNARAKAADLQTEVNRQKLADLRDKLARDIRISWQDSNRAFERLAVTKQLREQASLSLDLAQARYNLGLGSIVEFTQAVLQKTDADITDTDAKYQYRLTQITLAYTIAAPK